MSSEINRDKLEEIADIEMKAGQDALIEHDVSGAIKHIRESLKILKQAENLEKYVTNLNILGMAYAMERNETKAFDCYLESLATAEVMNSKNLKALSYSNIASCYQKMGKHNEAMKYFRDARKEYRNPSQRKEGNYEMWNSISYLNRMGAEKELIDNETVVLV